MMSYILYISDMNDKIQWELIMVDVTYIRYACDICMKIKKKRRMVLPWLHVIFFWCVIFSIAHLIHPSSFMMVSMTNNIWNVKWSIKFASSQLSSIQSNNQSTDERIIHKNTKIINNNNFLVICIYLLNI